MQNNIVTEEQLLASFGENQYNLANKYIGAINLKEKILNRSEISRIISHPNRSVQGWICGEHIPRPIRALQFLQSIRLIPLAENSNLEFILFTELVAFLFGDVHLMKHLGGFTLFGQKHDLEKIRSKIFNLYGISTKIKHHHSEGIIKKVKKDKVYSQVVKGSCWRLEVSNSPLSRLLHLAGVPCGDKVATAMKVPNWIMEGDEEIKRTFLGVLLGNELKYSKLRAKNAFDASSFGLHKIESEESSLKQFLEQIKNLLWAFGICTSNVTVDNSYKTIRKDGSFSKKLYFSINSHSPNIMRLFKEIPFIYADQKQQKFTSSAYYFSNNISNLKKEWEIYDLVIKMHESGLGRRRIFKKLNLTKNYFYKINSWLHYGSKPLYYDEREIL